MSDVTDENGRPSLDRWWRVLVVTWALAGAALVVGLAGWALGKVAGALTPFLIALVFAYLLRGPVARLESRGMSRGFAVLLCYLVLLAVLVIVGVVIVPPVERQVVQFTKDFPSYYDKAFAVYVDMRDRYGAAHLPSWIDDSVKGLRDDVARQGTLLSARVASGLVAAGGQAATLLFNTLLAFVIGFWALRDFPKIRKEVLLLWREGSRDEAEHILHTISNVLGGYLRGQLIVSIVTGTLAGIGLAILGVPYALVLGIIVGLFNVVPYLGPLVGGIAAAIAAAFIGPLVSLWAIIVVIVAQQVTDIFVTPRVMSSQVDLHPLLVIFSLLAGGTLFGLVGLLLAIPVAAIAKGIFVYYFEKLTEQQLCTEDGVLFRTGGAPGSDAGDEATSCDAEPAATVDSEQGEAESHTPERPAQKESE